MCDELKLFFIVNGFKYGDVVIVCKYVSVLV